MEQVFYAQQQVETIYVDRFDRLKPSTILYLTQEMASGHCRQLGCDWDTMAQQGLFWAVVRHRIHIDRLPAAGETMHLETWPLPTTRTCYPRALAAFDGTGAPLFQVHTLWVLMDLDSRAMVLPGKSGVRVPGLLRGTELPAPVSLVPGPMEQWVQRQVHFSDLDRNGHMNNCRYLDWIADLFPSTSHATRLPKELSLCYLNEAREGEQLRLHWAGTPDGTVHVEITDELQGNRIFGAALGF